MPTRKAADPTDPATAPAPAPSSAPASTSSTPPTKTKTKKTKTKKSTATAPRSTRSKPRELTPPPKAKKRKKGAKRSPSWLVGVRAWEEISEEERGAKMVAFLEEYATTGRVAQSCQVAGMTTRAHQRWVRAYPEYAEAVQEARALYVEALEEEADRRGKEGVLEPTGFYRGKAAAFVRRYSDQLLAMRLKAEAPEKYAERSHSTQDVNVRALVARLDVTQLSDEQLNRLAGGESVLSIFGSVEALPLLPAPATGDATAPTGADA